MNSLIKKIFVSIVNKVNSQIFEPLNSMWPFTVPAISGVKHPSLPQAKSMLAFDLISLSTTSMC